MIIRVRSPYLIIVNEDGQTSAKIELRIWKANETKPTNPTYVFSKPIPSPTQTELSFNISPYLKDKITNNINDIYSWSVNFEVLVFINNAPESFNTISGIAVNGYNSYTDGLNKSYNEFDLMPFFNKNIKRQVLDSPLSYCNLFVYKVNNSGVNSYGSQNKSIDYSQYSNISGLYPIKVANNYSDITINNIKVFNISFINNCDEVLTPQLVKFINRYGGIDFLWFFKMRTDNVNIESKDYRLLQFNLNYDTSVGQVGKYNFNAKQSFRMNTGFVDENYSELIQDLLLSEKVWIGNSPAIVKTQGTELKTTIRNKNINYEIEFEYAYNLINNFQ